MVWRSVREGGDTKTKKSRRTLAMPRRCVDALKLHHERQEVAKKAAGDRWQDNDLVFASKVGTELDAHNVRRSFRAVLEKAGLDPKDWTPREMRHSFVSLLSDSGIADRGHLTPGRPPQHQRDGDCLPQAAPPGAPRGCRSYGSDLRSVHAIGLTDFTPS